MAGFASRYWTQFAGVGAGALLYDYLATKHKTSVQREQICEQAMAIGDEPLYRGQNPTKVYMIVNSTAGKGANGKVEEDVRPVVHLSAMVSYTKRTTYAGEAKDSIAELDLDEYDGICVVGGDGLLQEVVTGLMRRPDREAVEQFPIGFIPIGTAGIMGSALHTHPDITATSKIGRAVLAVAQQKTRKIDVMEITNSKGQQIFATSCFGWGILGAMLNKIELHKGLGGQKYWYGAVETVAGYHGPVRRQASLQFRKDASSRWESRDLDISSLIAANVPKSNLGTVDRDIAPDDGSLVLGWVPWSTTPDRYAFYNMGFALSEGTPMTQLPGVESTRAVEFKLQPSLSGNKEHDAPFNVDGEEMPPFDVHVRLLPRCLTFFAQPPALL